MATTTLTADGKVKWRGSAEEAVLEHRHCPTCGYVYFPLPKLGTVCDMCHRDLPKQWENTASI